jgi:hypothetical protein
MRRLWMIAALTAVLAVPAALAQRRGGSFGGGSRMGSFSHAPVSMNHGASFSGFSHSNHVTFNTSPNHFHHFHNQFRRRFFAYPYYPYYGYDPYLWGSASSYDSSDEYYQQNQQLSQQVNELSNEVARLRDEQEIRAYTPLPTERQATPQAAAKSEVSVPTVLVFRDQHREDISNYAVVGRTVWVFNQDRARKIPLAELDVPATVKINDDRGVDFNVPR